MIIKNHAMSDSFEKKLLSLKSQIDDLVNQYIKEKSEPEEKKTEKKTKKKTIKQSVQEANLSDYVFMPSHNLYVAKERTLQGKDWYKTQAAVHKQDARMLNLREFADFLLLLKSGNAEDGLGNKISKSDLQTLYLDIAEARNPYRAEWLDARFENKNGILNINYNHRVKGNKLVPLKFEHLETCVMRNCKVELSSFNKQGMPRKEGTDFNYWYLVEGSVAGFVADAGGAYLYCDWDPSSSNADLGVRVARKK